MEKQIPPTNCETCGAPMRHIPAGLAKASGKPYDEFWACSDRCGFTWKPAKQGDKKTPTPLKEYDQGEVILGEIKKIKEAIDEINEKINIPIIEE